MNETIEEPVENIVTTTRSRRMIKRPERFREFKNLLIEEVNDNFKNDNLIELLCVGAGIGEGILHTGKLHVLKYKDALAGVNQDHWKNAINE